MYGSTALRRVLGGVTGAILATAIVFAGSIAPAQAGSNGSCSAAPVLGVYAGVYGSLAAPTVNDPGKIIKSKPIVKRIPRTQDTSYSWRVKPGHNVVVATAVIKNARGTCEVQNMRFDRMGRTATIIVKAPSTLVGFTLGANLPEPCPNLAASGSQWVDRDGDSSTRSPGLSSSISNIKVTHSGAKTIITATVPRGTGAVMKVNYRVGPSNDCVTAQTEAGGGTKLRIVLRHSTFDSALLEVIG